MNPLTQVKQIQSINSKESDLGISEEASWHAKYKKFLPNLRRRHTVRSHRGYGEVVDVNLIRDKGTGKSKGYAFLAYEDQRSTTLAVDNLNGAQVLGRIIRVDHCSKYVKREEEDEETKRQNREARGVCRAFQRGKCTRGDSCKFSHDDKRASNTGWGHEEDISSKRDHDKFNGAKKGGTKGRERVEREDRGPRSRDAHDRREQMRSGRLDDSQCRRHNAENDYIREDKRSRTHDREKLKAGYRRDHNDSEGEGSSRQSETSSRQARREDHRR